VIVYLTGLIRGLDGNMVTRVRLDFGKIGGLVKGSLWTNSLDYMKFDLVRE